MQRIAGFAGRRKPAIRANGEAARGCEPRRCRTLCDRSPVRGKVISTIAESLMILSGPEAGTVRQTMKATGVVVRAQN